MGIGFTEVRRRFKRAQIDLGVRDTAESPRDLREALLRAGTTEKKRVTSGTRLQRATNGAGAGSGALGFGSVERAGWA